MARSQIYRFLARAFDYPAARRKGLYYFAEALPWFRELPSEKLENLAALIIQSTQALDLESLQQEYVRLFDYRPVCPIQESSYMNNSTMTDLINSLVEFYSKSGLSCGNTMPPDHLVTELELMQYLCFQEFVDCEKNPVKWRELQIEFLASHLATWVPAFASRLESMTDTPYRLLGKMAMDFIGIESIS